MPNSEIVFRGNLLQCILNSTADGIVVADTAGQFLLFNPAAEQLIGLGLTHAAPTDWPSYYGCYAADGVTPLDPDDIPLVRAMRGEEVTDFEMFVRNQGRPEGIWLCVNARPLRDDDGTLLGGVVALRDVSGVRKARESVDLLNQRLAEQVRQHATANERLAAEVAERRRIELALRVSQEEDRRFQERLVALLEISSELSHTESVDDLFRRAVELGRARLGFDRLSIWLLHPDGRTATGTYGTDESGRLRDERCQRVSLKLLGDETLTLRRACLKFDDTALRDGGGRKIGEGARASASIWDGSRVIGLIHTDNLIKRLPLRDRDCRILAQYADLIGHLYLRKQAEEEVRNLNAELHQKAREQETRYRLAAKATRDAIWDWDLNTGNIEWNEGIQILFGYDTLNLPMNIEWWSSRIHPEDRDRVVKSLAQVTAGNDHTWMAEYRFARRDNTYATVVDRGYLVRDEKGTPVRMVGAMADMTEERRSQAELARSVSLLEATLESTADGILVVDLKGEIISYNRKFAALWRLPPDVLAAGQEERIIEYVLPQVRNAEQFLARVRELYRNPETESLDVIEFIDGRIFERYSQVRRLSGETIGRVWSFRDVTARERAKQSLQREQEFLRTLLENLTEGIVACDASGNITLFNRATREIYPVEHQPVRPEDWAERYQVFSADGRTPMRPDEVPLYRALRGEEVRDVEIVFKPPGGEPRSIVVNGNAILSPDGQQVGAVIVMHDVTERNRLQRQFLQTQKLESIGTLAGGIAHDFNNLLAVILGNASMHLRDRTLPAKLRSSLEDITDAAERGSALTHQLLAYARGGLQRLGAVDLNGVIESVVQMLRRTAPSGIEFVLELSRNLPAIQADPSQIEQVIMNLALNAVQASTAPARVIISTREVQVDANQSAALDIEAGRYARLQVRDLGVGMDAETLDRIFEPFFTTKFTGRGMGLAATQGIVRSHHGQIQAESRPGEGTTMSVWLPVAVDATQIRPRPQSPRRINPPTGSETILMLDDDPAITRTVSQILQSLGYCVVAHTDPEATVAFIENNADDVDLVLLDLSMPKISGREMFARIRQRLPRLPIVLASGFDEPQLAESAQEWGAEGFIHKPFSITVLARVIRKVLDERITAQREEST